MPATHVTQIRARVGLACFSIVFVLSGCGGDSKPSTNTQESVPALSIGTIPTPPGTAGPSFVPPPLEWQDCQGRSQFQCATLTVPLDPDRADSPLLGMAVIRQQAKSADSRIGVLVSDPGGPGASGVEFLPQLANVIPAAIADSFDLIGFDPRGVGSSQPLVCVDGPTRDALVMVDPSPDNAAELDQAISLTKEFVQGCQRDDAALLPVIGTKYVARDLDYLRVALGEQKLNYLGYSYGTAIGLSYANQFPTNIRSMVLDGVQDPQLDAAQSLKQQLVGFEAALNDFFADCASRSKTCTFYNHGDPAAAWDKLQSELEMQPLETSDSDHRTMGPGEFLVANISALYYKQTWPRLADALSTAQSSGDGSKLLALTDSYTERRPDGTYPNILDSNTAVNCADLAKPTDPDVWTKLATELATEAPRVGKGVEYSGVLGCDLWPNQPTVAPIAATAPGSPPILLVGSTDDPATPYEAAVSVHSQLANSVLLTRDGYGHTSYAVMGNRCIDDAVNNYLLSGDSPKPDIHCAS